MAIVQFALVFYHYLDLTDAVRTGARVAAISASTADPAAAAREAVRSAANGLDPARLTINTQDLDSATWRTGDRVKVSAAYPYTITIFGLPVWSGSLSGTTTERVE